MRYKNGDTLMCTKGEFAWSKVRVICVNAAEETYLIKQMASLKTDIVGETSLQTLWEHDMRMLQLWKEMACENSDGETQ
ncbi:MAG: hypothetical protein KKD77_20135 [Gammaproteobacteria bacterium]|nr:hypothetical protein [Gammaproteobacteria bacterium]